jgi:hypothetical protein
MEDCNSRCYECRQKSTCSYWKIHERIMAAIHRDNKKVPNYEDLSNVPIKSFPKEQPKEPPKKQIRDIHTNVPFYFRSQKIFEILILNAIIFM